MGVIEMRVFLGITAAIALAVTIGCSEGTTRKDVAAARDKLEKEKQQTSETINEGRREVAQAQEDAREHVAAKPVTPDQATTEAQKIAEARNEAAEDIAQQKEKERAAAADLADKEQSLQMTQARDAYVREVETKLADTDKQIDILKERASNAQGTDKEAINQQVDTLKSQRDIAKKALNDLKDADLAHWKNHQEHVRLALQDLDKSTRTIR